jgi:hypothetical protein
MDNPVLDYAVFGDESVTWGGGGGITSNSTNGDIFSNGDVDLGYMTGGEIQGSITAVRDIIWATGYIRGNLWAGRNVSTFSLCLGSDPDCGSSTDDGMGYLRASTGTAELWSTWTEHECYAATTIDFRSNTKCYVVQDGGNGPGPYDAPPAAYENSPSTPPEELETPTYTYDFAGDWEPLGYTRHVYTGANACTDARSYLSTFGQSSGPAGNHLVELINTDCTLSFPNNSKVYLRGNLAIIFDGKFETVNNNDWTSSPTSANYSLHIIHPTEAGIPPCVYGNGNPSTSPDDIVLSNNTAMTNVQVFLFTPCQILAQNRSRMSGQAIAGKVDWSGNGGIGFTKVPVEGFASSGYTAAPTYIRELTPDG